MNMKNCDNGIASAPIDMRLAHPLPSTPTLCVVMPCLNEAKHIGRTLQAIAEQECAAAKWQVVVVDGGSTDGTREIVEEFAARDDRFTLLHNPKRLAGPARNIAIRHAQCDVIAIIDAHCLIPTRRLLETVVGVLRESSAYCLSRPQPLHARPSARWDLAAKYARASWLGHCPGSLVYEQRHRGYVSPVSGAQVYRREVFDIVGYFAENIDACEDLEFNMRVASARLATFHCPSIAVEYFPRKDVRALYRHMVRYGHGRVLTAGHHRRSLRSVVGLAPSMFIAFVVLGGLLWSASRVLGAIHAGVVLAYLALIVAESVRIGARHGWSLAPHVAAALMATHFGWGVGQIRSLCAKARPRRSVSE